MEMIDDNIGQQMILRPKQVLPRYKEGIKKLVEEYPADDPFWQEIEDFAHKRYWHLQRESFDTLMRVEIAKLTPFYEFNSIAEYVYTKYGLILSPNSLTGFTQELAAIIICVLGERNPYIKVTDLTEKGLARYHKARQMEDRIKVLRRSLPKSDRFKNYLEQLPTLAKFKNTLMRDWSIRDLLEELELTYKDTDLLDNSFYKFLLTGETDGVLILLRRAMYAEWLKSEDLTLNQYNTNIATLLDVFAEWLFDFSQPGTTSNLSQPKTFLRNFMVFIAAKDLESFLGSDNYSVTRIKAIFGVSKDSNEKDSRDKKILHFSQEVITDRQDWSEFLNEDRNTYDIPVHLSTYFNSMGIMRRIGSLDQVVNMIINDTTLLKQELAFSLGITSADNVGETCTAGLKLLDVIFLMQDQETDPQVIFRRVLSNPVKRIFDGIRDCIVEGES